MKIVINRQFGGFGLSHKAVMRYAELKGMELYFSVDASSVEIWGSAKEARRSGMVHYTTVPVADGTLSKDYPVSSYWSYIDVERNDPLLVQVVTELGEEANGPHATLEIVDIPDGIEWEIDEYDGMETVEEKHRSWP